MKRLLILFLFLSALSATAQFRNQGRGGLGRQNPGQFQNQPRAFEFNPEKAIGITIYKIDKVAKKLSLKETKPEYQKLKNILYRFNKDIKQLIRINSFTFSQVKQEVEKAYKTSNDSKNFTAYREVIKKTAETFKPVVAEVLKKEKELDTKLEPILSKKQFKKWKKYKERIKSKRT